MWVRDASPLAAFTTAWFDNFDQGLEQWTKLLAKQHAARASAAGGGGRGHERAIAGGLGAGGVGSTRGGRRRGGAAVAGRG
jgi:hypothetical protein